MQKIVAIYKQQVSTIHPDTIIEVPFRYSATIDDDENVDIEWVQLLDGIPQPNVRITGKDQGIKEFLAFIREHARETAYKIRKKNGDV